ncbi:MAG TPA: hypothetical protein VGM03_11690, partial [Phycisphaerae bacterium]
MLTTTTIILSYLTVSPWGHKWLLLPLCLSISIVYKTLRCRRLRDVPLSALVLWITIIIGMYAVGIGMFAVYRLFA